MKTRKTAPRIASAVSPVPAIKIATEALRMDSRRSQRVLEVCSPLILKLMSYLFDLLLFELRS
jgi:hypothetical protein